MFLSGLLLVVLALPNFINLYVETAFHNSSMWSFWVAVFEQGLALILACLPALRITLRLLYRGERDDGTKNRSRGGTGRGTTLSTKDNITTTGGDNESGRWGYIGDDVEGFAVRLEDIDTRGYMIRGVEKTADDKSDHRSGGECSSLGPIVDHVVGESLAKRVQRKLRHFLSIPVGLSPTGRSCL